ncbi:MAG: radical SAM protein [Acidobacteriota bacterium]
MYEGYFFLRHNRYLELGCNGAAIYDVENKMICAIDLQIGKLINSCKQGKRLEKIFENSHAAPKREIIDYLSELEKNGLGFFSDNYIVIENLLPSWSLCKRDESKGLEINKLYLEITKLCNLDCIHCIEENGAIAKCSCSRLRKINTNENEVPLTLWKKIVKDAHILKCKELNIIGGEPFLVKQKVLEIIKCIDNKISSIKVKTNLLLIDEEIIKILKKFKITIESNFYSYQSDIHDQITNYKGSWAKWVDNCKKLLRSGIKVNVTNEIMNINKDHIRGNEKFLYKIGVNNISTRLIYSFNKTVWPDPNKELFFKKENSMNGVTKDQYFFNKERNPCWYGKIAISYDGNIRPCIMATSYTMGSIFKKSLIDVFREDIQMKWWTFTKDKINKCRDCEFRYACSDCRPIESRDNKLSGENRFCKIY